MVIAGLDGETAARALQWGEEHGVPVIALVPSRPGSPCGDRVRAFGRATRGSSELRARGEPRGPVLEALARAEPSLDDRHRCARSSTRASCRCFRRRAEPSRPSSSVPLSPATCRPRARASRDSPSRSGSTPTRRRGSSAARRIVRPMSSASSRRRARGASSRSRWRRRPPARDAPGLRVRERARGRRARGRSARSARRGAAPVHGDARARRMVDGARDATRRRSRERRCSGCPWTP